jgi:hypothetical protein
MTHKMTRRKIKDSQTSKYYKKKHSKFTRAKHHPPLHQKKTLKKKIEDPQTLKRNHSPWKL